MNKTYNLFLDDERHPANVGRFFEIKHKRALFFNLDWIVVRTYNDFIQTISNNGIPNLISFDHDLGQTETGFDCAKWLIDYCMDNNIVLPEFLVHSRNPVGANNIMGLLKNYKEKYEN